MNSRHATAAFRAAALLAALALAAVLLPAAAASRAAGAGAAPAVSGWVGPTRVVPAYRPLSVSASLDGGGRIHVAWFEDQSIAGDPGIFYATSRGGWHRERVTTGDSFYASPSIAVDDDGTVFIAFARLTCPTPGCQTGTSRIMVAERRGDTWTVTPLTSGPADLSPSLAIHAGRLHLAFQRRTFPGNRGDAASGIWYATNATGSWSHTQVTTANGRCGLDQLPSLAVDDRGRAWIAYEGVRPGTSCAGFSGGLRIATNTSGSWRRVTLTLDQDDFGASLALDRSGRPGLAFDRAGVGVEFMRSSATTGWSAPVLVDGQGGEPSLSFDRGGRPRVAYERTGIWYAGLVGGWQRTRLYRGPVDSGTYGGPALLVPRSGDARVIYGVAEPDDDSTEDELGIFLARQE